MGLLPGNHGGDGPPAGLERSQAVDHLLALVEQGGAFGQALLEFIIDGRGRGPGRGLDLGGEGGQQLGIEGVGFGPAQQDLGKVMGLGRVNDADGDPGVGEGQGEGQPVGVGRFEGDQGGGGGDPSRGQPGEQGRRSRSGFAGW